MKEIDIWEFASECIRSGLKAALLIVAESGKSSPGRAGFKMVLSESGEIMGTIGGGIMEHRLIEEAKENFSAQTGFSFIKKLVHSKKTSGNESGLICGGTQTMIIRSLSEKDLNPISELISHYSNLIPGVLSLDPKGIVFTSSAKIDGLISFRYKSDSDWYYSEMNGYPDTVYVIGGGHVGLAVSKVMATQDFYVITIDARKDLFTMKRNTFSDRKLTMPYSEAGNIIIESERSYVVIVTSEHDNDMAALKSVISKNVKYIGMMGSKVKIRSIFRSLIEQGIDASLLDKVHTPIGIEIGADTPEEIAVSIAAEIISVKNVRKTEADD